MKTIIENLIRFVLKQLAGVTAQQWASAILWVRNAAQQYADETGASKKEKVANVLGKQFPMMEGWKVDTLIQCAFAYLRYQKQV